MSKIKLKDKYSPLLTSESRYFLISGGRGSGKSFSIATILALLTFEPDEVILFSRYTMVSAELSVIPEFLEKLEIMGIAHLFSVTSKEIINNLTGSKIIFRGIKTGSKLQTANLKSISGLTCWVVDEAEELTDEDLFDDVARSVRVKDKINRIMLVFNPPTKSHFTYPKFFLNKGVEPSSNLTKGNTTYIHTTYLDNIENLNEDFIEEAEELRIKDKKKWERVYGGAYRDKAEGLIFDNWKLGEFPSDDEKAEYGLDFGFNDYNAMVKIIINHNMKTVHVKEMIYAGGMTITDLIKKVISLNIGKSLVIADSAAPAIIKDLDNVGVNIRGIKKPTINESIEVMKDYELIIDPNSKGVINELNNYCWDKNYKRGDRPIDDFNDLMDALRYIIWYRHRNKKKKRFRIY